MRKIKISVIIPIYNVEKYLRKCLESIINQTLKEIEIITVNDGSTDTSLEILKKYAEKDERVVIINKENGGLSSARNAGLKIAQGEYISFIDSDDFVELTMMEELYKCTKKEKYEVVSCNVFEYNNITKSIKKRKNEKEIENKGIYLIETCGIEVWNKIYRTDFLISNNLFFKEGVINEDNLFTLKVFLLAEKVKYIDKSLYYYRMERENSIMHLQKKSLKTKGKDSFGIIIDELIKFRENYPKKSFENIYLGLKIEKFIFATGNFQKKLNENILETAKKEWKNFSEKEKEVLKILIRDLLKIKSFNRFNLFDSFYWKNGIMNKKIFRRGLEKKLNLFNKNKYKD